MRLDLLKVLTFSEEDDSITIIPLVDPGKDEDHKLSSDVER